MRTYTLNVICDPEVIKEALLALNLREYSVPLGQNSGEDRATRVLTVEHTSTASSLVKALVKISYRVQGRKYWSDLYWIEIKSENNCMIATVRRISGVGRTDPDFIIDELLKYIVTRV
ncbi:MAG: hypothetical protein NZ954_08135 [Thermofilaceae archaeon]|nr:hypothetical protein [Thermofilaceae archaeon]MCX8180210.1 hypothetical protein [Thermofilaceae archaeon]MDW8003600.1 hypothetical protein [Thermofilaceae archaeon]